MLNHTARRRPVRPAIASVLVLLLLFGLAPVVHAQAPTPSITITDLGPGVALAINDRGQVVGSSGDHAVLWEHGTMTDLGTLGGPRSQALAINAQGQVVGWSDAAGEVGSPHAVLWQNGTMTDLDTFPGRTFSIASAINDQRQVVGMLGGHAVLWEHGTMTDLGTLPGSTGSGAYGINNYGHVVGQSDTDSGTPHAVLWNNGTMTDLGPGYALDINDRGQMVGWNGHATLWDHDTITDLGTLGGEDSVAQAINAQGQIVGGSVTGDEGGASHAFLWDTGTLRDLGTLPGGASSEAFDINKQGQIVGWSTTASGEFHAVRWEIAQTPATPEQHLATLRGNVQALIDDGHLNRGNGHALQAKLDGARAQLERGNTTAAANHLQAFVHQVEAFRKAKKLTAVQAQPLLDAAKSVIEQLQP